MYAWCICKRCLSYLEYHRTVASPSLLLCLFLWVEKITCWQVIYAWNLQAQLSDRVITRPFYHAIAIFLITVNNTYNIFMHTNIISQRIEKSMRCVSLNTYTYKYKQIEILQCLIAFAYSYYKKIKQDAYLLYYVCAYSL